MATRDSTSAMAQSILDSISELQASLRSIKETEVSLLHTSNNLLHELITGREWRTEKVDEDQVSGQGIPPRHRADAPPRHRYANLRTALPSSSASPMHSTPPRHQFARLCDLKEQEVRETDGTLLSLPLSLPSPPLPLPLPLVVALVAVVAVVALVALSVRAPPSAHLTHPHHPPTLPLRTN